MAPKYDSEDKCAFLPYDCVPGRIAWVAFKQNLFANGGRGNDWGDTLAHAFMGTNTGGVNGIAHAGMASDVRKSLAGQRRLQSEALMYLNRHINDEHRCRFIQETFGILAGPVMNARDAFLYLQGECDVADSREGEDQHDIAWLQFSISANVGKDEFTIKNAVKALRTLNAGRPANMRKTSDDIAEKLLRMIVSSTSSAIGTEAQKELEAVQGVAGMPGVRIWQSAMPAPGITRNLAGMANQYQLLWGSSYRAGHIQKSAASRYVAPSARGNEASEIARAGQDYQGRESRLVAPGAGNESQQQSLAALSEAGFSVMERCVSLWD